MISYRSCSSTTWTLFEDLGRVFDEPISRSILILEEAHSIYNSLFLQYEKNIESLRRIVKQLQHGGFRKFLPRIELFLAAREGNLEIIQDLRNELFGRVVPLSVGIMERAVEHGHMDVVRALRDGSLGEVCPWDSSAPVWAAVKGHLEVIRALRDGSLGGVCPWDKEECRRCARKYPEIVELIDSGVLD